MSTIILSDTRFAAHTQYGHVEHAGRLEAIEQALAANPITARLTPIIPEPASEAQLHAVHAPQMLAQTQRMSSYGGGQIDGDTYVTADSWQAATLAAGAAVGAVDAVWHGRAANAFALVRPPGHHATPSRAMGFCLINNIAVAARYATQQLGAERVAIVDYDVHHGNGTQDAFYGDPQVLFISTHATPLYPGTGMLHEIGAAGPAHGSTLNIPLPFGVGDAGYAQVFSQLVLPALRRFQPELILVSAGYDAHWKDPLGPMRLSVDGYANLSAMLIAEAKALCDGRIAFLLEGGYNLDALGACVVATLHELLGEARPADPFGPDPSREPQLGQLIAQLRNAHPLLANEAAPTQ